LSHRRTAFASRPDESKSLQGGAEWQLVIPKSQWKKTNPVKLIVTGNRMELVP